jgi:hypothetical protein
MAKTSIDNQPTVSRRHAAMFFNMGRDKFLNRWESHFKFTIRHVQSEKGLRLLLMDVIKAAFPNASSETKHLIAYHYLQDTLQRRYITAAKKRTADDEGDTE